MKTIGIDIGGTKCALSVWQADGTVAEVARFATEDRDRTLARLLEEAARLEPDSSSVFGISCGGPLDAEKGVVLSPPNLPSWDRVPICECFQQRFGGRAFLMNDANACALAEWHFGAGRGVQNMIFLTAGTGLGAGLILNGRLYEGTTGDAGEVGHMRLSETGPVGYGKEGSFEGYCSGGGIARLARLRYPSWAGEEISTREIAEAATAGRPEALAVFAEAAERFGQALALLVDVLNPERIVIGGIFPRCGHLLRPGLEAALAREALNSAVAECRIVPAELGETIGSHGAVSVALYRAGVWNA